MLRLLFLASAVALALAAPFTGELDGEWVSFKTTYNKLYAAEEEAVKRLVWESNVRHIRQHNLEADRGAHTYWLGVNEFADLTVEQFVGVMNGYRTRKNVTSGNPVFLQPSNAALPDQVDWRTKGYVTGVKNQGQCGSCWAFSTTGSLEGQHFKKTGQLVSLSEQNLVDCSGAEGNMGCGGGLMDQAFTYIKKNKGIDTEKSYPYTAMDGQCRFDPDNVGATDTGFVDIKKGNEADLKSAVATVGPISVAIDASHPSFQLYKSGVYKEPDCSSTFLDHGVLAVGYGGEGAQAYWLVKNSWGESWGMQGYIKMARDNNNMCGIATAASYPLV